jgi:hypothetical protein
MAPVRRLWNGFVRWFNADDVEPKRRDAIQLMRGLWVGVFGLPVLLGSIIGVIGQAAGWWH